MDTANKTPAHNPRPPGRVPKLPSWVSSRKGVQPHALISLWSMKSSKGGQQSWRLCLQPFTI
eukprot:4135110-Amphidinium_carterae.1